MVTYPGYNVMIKGLVFGAAGVKGISFLPVLEYWHFRGATFSATHFAGCSAGCFFAVPLALGASIEYIRTRYETTDWSTFSKVGGIRAFFSNLSMGGPKSLLAPVDWIKQLFLDFGLPDTLTFAQLKASRGSSLYLVATNETDLRIEVFSPENTPDVQIKDAMLASMAIQYYYPLVKIGEDHFSDGGLAFAYPIQVLADRGLLPEEILGVKIEDEPHKIASRKNLFQRWFNRAWRLLSLARDVANRAHISDALWARTVKVKVVGVPATEFVLNDKTKAYLLEQGRIAATEVEIV